MNINHEQYFNSYLQQHPEKIKNVRTGTTFQQEMKMLDLYLEMWLSLLQPNTPEEVIETSRQTFKLLLRNYPPEGISNSSIQLFLETRF